MVMKLYISLYKIIHYANNSGWAWIKNVKFDYYGERTPLLNELHLGTISTQEQIPPGIGLHPLMEVLCTALD